MNKPHLYITGKNNEGMLLMVICYTPQEAQQWGEKYVNDESWIVLKITNSNKDIVYGRK